MRTALAADEPEPEKARIYLVGSSTYSVPTVTYTGHTMIPTAEKTTAATPNPWQCPQCQTWLAPTVTEHCCSER